MKKGIKKYQWGTFSASGSTTPQMVNPGNSALKQINTAQTTETSTPSIADPNAKSMTEMKQFTNKGIQGPSFMDKTGNFMGNYGGAITQAAGTLMPLLMKKKDPNEKPYKKGSKLIKYQAGTNAADIIGPGPLDNMEPSISPIAPKMASFRAPEQTPMIPNLNRIPMQKQSRREKKAENERLFKMVRKDESAIEPLMPKMAKISLEIPAMQPSLKKVEVETPSKTPKFFDYHSEEAKGGYARALKGGKRDAKGNLVDPQTGYIYRNLKTAKNSSSAISRKNVSTTRVEKPTTSTPSGTMTGNELVLESKRGKKFNPYTMAGFPNPIPRTEVKTRIQKKETAKVDNRRVYPEESPLAKYRKGIPSKPATNVPTRVMDYPTQELLGKQRGELSNNMKTYGMVSPFNPNGSTNFYTPFFEMGHNTRFGKKK